MNSKLNKLITKIFPELKIETDVPTSFFSFIRTGGTASTVVFPKTADELHLIIKFFKENSIKYAIVGKCSNILFGDKPLDLIIIKTDLLSKIIIEENIVFAECGVGLCHLGLECMKNDLSGFEFSCGIPGSIGGGIVMNAGAFGSSISNIITKVYTISDDIIVFNNQECNFSYRTSRFLKTKECILAAEFELKKGDTDELRKNISEITKNRNNLQPKGLTLGSTFKNPIGASAGEIIEKAGLKGFGIGGAVVSDKHANFIMNIGNATSSDIIKLIDYIKDIVYRQSGIILEEEIQYLGEN